MQVIKGILGLIILSLILDALACCLVLPYMYCKDHHFEELYWSLLALIIAIGYTTSKYRSKSKEHKKVQFEKFCFTPYTACAVYLCYEYAIHPFLSKCNAIEAKILDRSKNIHNEYSGTINYVLNRSNRQSISFKHYNDSLNRSDIKTFLYDIDEGITPLAFYYDCNKIGATWNVETWYYDNDEAYYYVSQFINNESLENSPSYLSTLEGLFTTNNKLYGIYLHYISTSSDDRNTTYKVLSQFLCKNYGKPHYEVTKGSNTLGWTFDKRCIILTTETKGDTSDGCIIIQLNPELFNQRD